MEKTLSNGELSEIVTKLEAAVTLDVKLPPKVSYKIIKNKLSVKQALKPYQLAYDDIVRRLTGGKESISMSDDPRTYTEVMRAISEIARETVTVSVETIKLDDIPDAGTPINFIAALEFMIEEG